MGVLASPLSRYSPLAERFSRQFPAHDLPSVLAKFSLPVSLSEFRNPLAPPVQEVSRRSPRSPGTTHPVSVPHPRAPSAAAPLAWVLGRRGLGSVGGTCRARVTKSWLPGQATYRHLGQVPRPPTLAAVSGSWGWNRVKRPRWQDSGNLSWGDADSALFSMNLGPGFLLSSPPWSRWPQGMWVQVLGSLVPRISSSKRIWRGQAWDRLRWAWVQARDRWGCWGWQGLIQEGMKHME